MSNLGPLAGQIEILATRLPAAQVAMLATAIESLIGPTPAGRANAAQSAPTTAFKGEVAELWDAWLAQPEVSGASVALALRAAGGTAERLRTAQSMDIVWTGPSSIHVPVRMSGQVLLDLIDGARTELTVVSFAAYRVPEVRSSLQAAAARGVDVRLVLETAKDSGGRLRQDAADAFATLGADASLWYWPEGSRPEGGAAMHVKAAIADGHVALVTSANLTGAALEHNMELGLLVTGGSVPRRLAEHFRTLMADDILQRIQY